LYYYSILRLPFSVETPCLRNPSRQRRQNNIEALRIIFWNPPVIANSAASRSLIIVAPTVAIIHQIQRALIS